MIQFDYVKSLLPAFIMTFSMGIPLQSYSQTQVGNDIDGETAVDLSGWSVSMPDATTIAIGAYLHDSTGHVRIYEWTGKTWIQKGNDIDGESEMDASGFNISMPNPNTIAIGAIWSDGINGYGTGHVRVFEWTGTTWTQKGIDIDGEASSDYYGHSVSMPDENTVAIGGPRNSGNGGWAGHVRVYKWNGIAWTQKGNDIDGKAPNDQSGMSVSMPEANTVAIGAWGNYVNNYVRIYSWNGVSWVQKGIDIDGEAIGDGSGWSVSMPDTNTVAIGAIGNNGNGSRSGHVRIYSWNDPNWTQKGNDIDGEAAEDESGWSICMPNTNTVAIGSRRNGGNGIGAGHVRIYSWNGTTWIQRGSDIDGEASGDFCGSSVSMPDSNTVAIGAYGNDGNGNMAGHARVFSFAAGIGAPENIFTAKEICVYPNPTNGLLRFQLNQSQNSIEITITNLLGDVVYKDHLFDVLKFDFLLAGPSGVYIVSVRVGNTVHRIKVFKTE